MSELIAVERPEEAPGVQIIRMDRPEKKNALTRPMYQAMADAMRDGDADDGVRAHLFLGRPGSYSAGNDMADFLSYASGGALGDEVIAFLKALAGAKKPLVAGVDGLAIGVGTTMLFHCDLVVASTQSLFKTPFTDLAIVPEAASTLLMPQIAGHQNAFAMLAAGLPFDAEDAKAAGFVFKIVNPDALEATALDMAAALAAKPPQAMRIARDLIRSRPEAIIARIDEEAAHFTTQLKSAEARAAFEAFMARRS